MTAGATIEPPLLAAVDVCVIGAGSAGSTAAIAAARHGATVLLIDRLPFLGGTSTAVLDTFYGFYTPGGEARKVVGGIGDDVVAALRALGPVIERPNTYGAGTGVTYLAEHLKVAWEELVTSAGARVLLHAVLQGVDVRDGRVSGVVVATRAGLARVTAAVFVDASGDADLCAFAGFGYEMAGELDPAQTLTTTFRMANVDLARRRSISKAAFHAADGRGRRVRRLRPATARGKRPRHAGRRDDRDGHDPPRLVPARLRTAASSTPPTRGS